MELSDVLAFAEMGAAQVEKLNEGTVTIGGSNYQAAIGSVPLEVSSGAGGEYYEGVLLVHVRKMFLPVKPELKTKVTARGRTWSIFQVKGDEPAAVVWSLHLDPRN